MSDDRRVYIAQLLCPARHCILGLAHDFEGEPPQEFAAAVEIQFQLLVDAKLINPWCDVCQSRDLHVEVGQTKWRTMEEAREPLAENERQQAATAAFLKRSRN